MPLKKHTKHAIRTIIITNLIDVNILDPTRNQLIKKKTTKTTDILQIFEISNYSSNFISANT